MENPDNLVVTPWGDLWFAENGVSAGGEVEDRIMGVTPEGRVYPFARNRLSEFAGPTFVPDGQTVFVNIQDAGLTLAVWGRFTTTSAALRRRLALGPPPPSLAPGVSGELAEAAMRWGMTPYEAAAYARLGVALA
jgi:secreted PhoX family phosphatase